MTSGPDPYKILQVDPEAEDEVIQAAYRRLAQKYHPDRAPDADGAARMVAINAAWELIGEPDRRAAYDAERAASLRAATAGASSASPSAATSAPRSTPSAANRAAGPTPSGGASGTTGGQGPPETVSRDWTSGRSAAGGGYEASTMRRPEGDGAAGPPPGRPSGSVLKVGRYAGWSIGEIARTDVDYLEWLDRMAIGRQYREEIDQALRKAGRRRSAPADATDRRGLFRRR
ncbi:MAG: J domain-containing protein [Chloroflexota bacterium]